MTHWPLSRRQHQSTTCRRSKLRELSAGLPVSLEDRRILVDFYKHALVGVVSDWLEQGMKEDLSAVIRRIGVLLEGNIRRALENSIADE